MTLTHFDLLAALADTRTHDAAHVAASVLLRGGVPVCAPCYLDTPWSKR